MHYLEQELLDRIKNDSNIFNFLRSGALDGMWYWDLQNPDEEWMSPEFWRLFGYDPEQMPHKAAAWQDIINEDDLKVALENFNRHLEDPNHPYDQIVRYRHQSSGEWISVRCRGMAIRDESGKPIRMLGAHTDLTELAQTEQTLRSTVAELVHARETAEAALRAKTIFLETMSHEIRTPMNGILGMAQALEQCDLPEREAEMASIINRSAKALLTLLNDILDLSRIEAGKISMEMESIVPSDVVSDAVSLFSEVAKEKGLDMLMTSSPDTARPVIGSGRAIRQVISNLLGNAVKFADSGAIEVRSIYDKTENGDHRYLRVSVIDQGPGILDEDKARVFQRFAQGSALGHEKTRGTGLGLAIAQQLTELHGGTLTVTDTPGGGATFTAVFQVRRATALDRPAPTTPAVDANDAPIQLLIVEDNAMNRLVLRAMLETMHAELAFANDGAEALELCAAQTFDAAFVDIRMPVMSGTEFARRRRALEAETGAPRLRMIACSANVLPHQVDSYLEVGFDRHLPKPVTLDALREHMNWVITDRLRG